MYKSVSTKYFMAVMLILGISIVMLSSIFTAKIREYTVDDSDERLRKTCATVAQILVQPDADISKEHFGAAVWQAQNTIKGVVMINTDQNIIVTDASGAVLLSTVEGVKKDADIDLSAFEFYTDEEGERFLFSILSLLPDTSEKYRIYAKALTSREETVGYIMALKSTAKQDEILGVTSRAVIMGSLLMILAAVVAIYFITERMMRPLRSMTKATKRYAKGDFSARVEVWGDDEIAELGIAFNQMAQALDNLEKMRASFLQSVSHDLRTPMTVIAGFIDNINSGVIPPDMHRHYLEIVSNEVKRLSRMVNTLLDVSRLESGDKKYNFTDFDIAEMARLILISFEKPIEEKKIEVEFIAEDSIFVHADEDSIHRVIYNLCHNAIKFSAEGGLLRIKLERTKDEKVSVSVYNEGQGIAAEDLPYVFDRFYKSDKSRGLDKTGVGLGLYISKTMIDAHGETLCVKSEEGKNCEFAFSLKTVAPHDKNGKNLLQ